MINVSSPLYMSEEQRDKARGEMNRIVEQLVCRGAVLIPVEVNNVGAFECVVRFLFESVAVTVYLSLKDWQVESDVVITNMGTIPSGGRSKGYGSRAVACLIDWAVANSFNEIRATQVSNPQAEKFWRKNGFVVVPEPNLYGDLIYPLPFL